MTSKAAEILATALEQDADRQEQGELNDQFARIEKILREVKPINNIPRPIFKLATRFWKEWAIAAQRSWRHFGNISESDWPKMARMIAQHIRLGTLPNDKLILDEFVRKRYVIPWRELKRLFNKDL